MNSNLIFVIALCFTSCGDKKHINDCTTKKSDNSVDSNRYNYFNPKDSTLYKVKIDHSGQATIVNTKNGGVIYIDSMVRH